MYYRFLKKIKKISDLKSLSVKELDILAAEIRDYMVNVVSKTGGHLALSLGAVEVTLSIGKVFNQPSDKIIWDVGHQAYAHKILTGRQKKFQKLRQRGGVSGFLKIHESKFDVFGAGHASTAISAAMGIAKARDIAKGKYNVVAVVGDASFASGMSLEAINNIGHDKTNILIVVIDNEMSISRTVGAISEYFNRIVSGKLYINLKIWVKSILDHIPVFGSPTASIIKHTEEAIRGVLSPGMIFEELGLRYFGPINGHNIRLLTNTLNRIRDVKGPKLIHVITKKGKGYGPAEKNPVFFHGICPFDIKTGKPLKKESEFTYSNVFSETLVKIARRNKKITAIVAAMVEGTDLSKFKDLFPERFFDVGIAEEHAVTFAAGMAVSGMQPVVAIYSTFLQRGIDQIIHDVALQKLPVIFAMDRAGLVGEDGPTHHGIFDIVFMKMVPNMVVMAPSDENELRKALLFAADYRKGPVAIRFPRGRAWDFKKEKNPLAAKIGKSRLIKKGRDITVVNLGALLPYVIKAADELEKENKIKIEIIDARFAKPMDKTAILKSIRKTKKLVTIEEGAIEGGFGQSVIELAEKSNIKDINIRILGVPDRFIEHGTMEELRKECGLTSTGIKKAVLEIL